MWSAWFTLAAAGMMTLVAAGASEAPFIKKTDCGDICSRAFCVARKQEECDPRTEVFVKRDGDCYCCDVCIPKGETPALEKKCKPGHCDNIKCYDVPAKVCFDRGLAFIAKDECSCCDGCA